MYLYAAQQDPFETGDSAKPHDLATVLNNSGQERFFSELQVAYDKLITLHPQQWEAVFSGATCTATTSSKLKPRAIRNARATIDAIRSRIGAHTTAAVSDTLINANIAAQQQQQQQQWDSNDDSMDIDTQPREYDDVLWIQEQELM
eukprot:9864-Heterococcus_DN1.PRE.1